MFKWYFSLDAQDTPKVEKKNKNYYRITMINYLTKSSQCIKQTEFQNYR